MSLKNTVYYGKFGHVYFEAADYYWQPLKPVDKNGYFRRRRLPYRFARLYRWVARLSR